MFTNDTFFSYLRFVKQASSDEIDFFAFRISHTGAQKQEDLKTKQHFF